MLESGAGPEEGTLVAACMRDGRERTGCVRIWASRNTPERLKRRELICHPVAQCVRWDPRPFDADIQISCCTRESQRNCAMRCEGRIQISDECNPNGSRRRVLAQFPTPPRSKARQASFGSAHIAHECQPQPQA